jgi:uncharacterized protein (TIGR03083 family)
VLDDYTKVRNGCRHASATLISTIGAIPDRQWDQAGALGEWTVRQLLGHTLRAFTTIEAYLLPAADQPATIETDAVGYYHIALAAPDLHQAIAERGRQAGADLSDPVAQTEEIVRRVLGLIDATADHAVVKAAAGVMTFGQYLTTRLVELVVHTVDLQRATGQVVTIDPDSAGVVIGLLATLADPVELLCALTGRSRLPDTNVLG